MLPQAILPCLVTLLSAAGPPDPVHFAADFASQKLEGYRVQGDVKRQDGRVTLGPKATFGRPLRAGHQAELRAVVRLPAGKESYGLALGLDTAGRPAVVAVITRAGRARLLNLSGVQESIDLGPAAGGQEWNVRVQLRDGVVRARAWRGGAAEPRDWQTTRYAGRPDGEVRGVVFTSGPTAGGSVRKWSLTGAAPAPPLPAEEKKLADRARELTREVMAHYRKGEYRDAAAKGRESLALVRRAYGGEHLETALALYNLAGGLYQAGRYREAIACQERAVALRRKLLGEDHPETAVARNNLGILLLESGDLAAARRQLERAAAARRKVLGPDDPDTAQALLNLGGLLHRRGEYAAARPHYEQALAVFRKTRGPESPEAAQVLSTLGSLHQDLGDYAAARKCHDAALAAFRKVRGPRHPDTAHCLDGLGTLLSAMGDYPAARKCYDEALSIRKEVLGEDHPDTALSLNNLATLLARAGEYEEALRLLKRALAAHDTPGTLENFGAVLREMGRLTEARRHLERALALHEKSRGPDHPDAVVSLNHLGLVLQELGEHDAARRVLERALALTRRVLGPDHPHTALSLLNLAALMYEGRDFAAARPYLEQGLAVQDRIGDVAYPSTADYLDRAGSLLRDMGEYRAARRALERALAIRTRVLGPRHRATADSLNQLGVLFKETGDYPAARSLLEEALATYDRAGRSRTRSAAAARSNLGLVLHAVGQHAAAEQSLDRALALFRELEGAEGVETALALSNRGMVRTARGRHAAAREDLEGALAIYRRRGKAADHLAAVTRNNLGLLHRAAGDDAAARKAYEQALEAGRKAWGDDHPLTALTRNNLGVLLLDAGEYEAAGRSLEGALAAYQKVLGPDHPDTARALASLGAVRAARGQPRAAWDALVEAAAGYAGGNRRYLAASAEGDFAGKLTPTRYSFDLIVSLAAENPALARERGTDLAAAVLDWKAGAARSLGARQEALALGGDADARRRYGELVGVRRELARVLLCGPGPGDATRYRDHRKALEDRRDALERELARAVDGYAALRRRLRAGPRELAARLGADAVLVELVSYRPADFRARGRGKRWGAPRYAAVLMSRPAGVGAEPVVRLVALGEAAPVDEAIRDWRSAAQKGAVPPEVDRRLRRRVWEPLAAALPRGARRLVVAPDSQLALIPFEAIRLEDDVYLVERYEVSYVANGHDLLPPPAPAGKPGPAVVVADPDYDAGPDRGEGLVPPPGTAGLPGTPLGGVTLRFRRLPGFAREADRVTAAWRGARSGGAELLRGRDASEERLAGLKRPRLLYLITHGFFLAGLGPDADAKGRGLSLVPLGAGGPARPGRPEDPRLRSGLALSGANRWKERSARGLSDGLLTALEAEGLDLWGTELVVLSACETGLGEVRAGEGVLGLRRAFQLAGARTVVASLWKVPDRETERLMARFLAGWLAGRPKARALRDAQLQLIGELRKSAQARHKGAPPLFWAAFVCHGQPD